MPQNGKLHDDERSLSYYRNRMPKTIVR